MQDQVVLFSQTLLPLLPDTQSTAHSIWLCGRSPFFPIGVAGHFWQRGGRSTSKSTCVVPAWTLTSENASFGVCASRWWHQLTSDPKRCLLFWKCLQWSCLTAVSVPAFVIGGLRGSTATSGSCQKKKKKKKTQELQPGSVLGHFQETRIKKDPSNTLASFKQQRFLDWIREIKALYNLSSYSYSTSWCLTYLPAMTRSMAWWKCFSCTVSAFCRAAIRAASLHTLAISAPCAIRHR